MSHSVKSIGRVALYVGRFQPFHNGHLYAIKNILKEVDEVVIAIGSSQYAGLPTQPFSAIERKQMIEETLKAKGITRYSIVEVPDINDDDRWVGHVQNYVHNFDLVYTGNPHPQRLFEKKGIEVRPVKLLPGVSGTLIRRRMKEGKKWQDLVSLETKKVIEERHAI